MTKIAIVDEDDRIIGAAERSEARAKGLRHRIVRLFLVNAAGEVLLQRRSPALIDNPGRWDQSVGGHVDEGEDYATAAQREAKEELGITVSELRALGTFYIEREAPGGVVRRFQTVFIGRWDSEVRFNQSEIAEVRWVAPAEIAAWQAAKPDEFTRNFAAAFGLVQQALAKN